MSNDETMAGNELPVQIFVYGTLVNGYCNHFLLDSSTFKGAAKTVQKYALHVADYPFVVNCDPQSHIMGEVYTVDTPEALEFLDQLEAHPVEYIRCHCKVQMTETGDVVDAQIYFNNNKSVENTEFVPSGDFSKSASSQKYLLQHCT